MSSWRGSPSHSTLLIRHSAAAVRGVQNRAGQSQLAAPTKVGCSETLCTACNKASTTPARACLFMPAGKLAPSAPDSKLGYIRVATFSKQTAEKVRAALESLKAQVGLQAAVA